MDYLAGLMRRNSLEKYQLENFVGQIVISEITREILVFPKIKMIKISMRKDEEEHHLARKYILASRGGISTL